MAKRSIRTTLLALALAAAGGTAVRALDYPHSYIQPDGCSSECHVARSSLENLLPPQYAGPAEWPGDTPALRVCQECHNGGRAPAVQTHSSYFVGTKYGSWGFECTVCHTPHQQKQVRSYGSESILATGVSTGLTATTLTRTGAGWTANQWKGYVLVPNVNEYDHSYGIVGNTADTLTIDDGGGEHPIDRSLADPGDTFAIVYGKLVKTTVTAPGGPRSVKLLTPSGPSSFAPAGGGFAGVCEICHTKTDHFRNAAGAPDPTHTNVTAAGLTGDNCVRCHEHKNGFKHRGGRGANCVACHGNDPSHAAHTVTMGFNCDRCHDMDNFPLFKDGKSLAATTACAGCHQDGRGGLANDLDFKQNWGNAQYHLGCDGCHGGDARPVLTGVSTGLTTTTLTVAGATWTPNQWVGRKLFPKYDALKGYTIVSNTATVITVDGAAPMDLGKASVGNTFQVFSSKIMGTNGHRRLVNPEWIRRYACSKCHFDSVGEDWTLKAAHANGQRDVKMDPYWDLAVDVPSSYALNPATGEMECQNVYCHSDGTRFNPAVKNIAWDYGAKHPEAPHLMCNGCHGHPINDCTQCHAGEIPNWTEKDTWKSSMPMYHNEGKGSLKPNSHERHLMTDFSCDECHRETVVETCNSVECHADGIPVGKTMGETGHVKPAAHVNKNRNLALKNGDYNSSTKTCTNTRCHSGSEPVWGDDHEQGVVCLSCHANTETDLDDYPTINATTGEPEFNSTQAQLNRVQWATTGHGRTTGVYGDQYGATGGSRNPAANFPTDNPCGYCHDGGVLHKTTGNPFRLRKHPQFTRRFERECVYCHMERENVECRECHNATDDESLSPQLKNLGYRPSHAAYAAGDCVQGGCHAAGDAVLTKPWAGVAERNSHTAYATQTPEANWTDCLTADCHPDDARIHKTGSDKIWTIEEKDDIRNQYEMLGVCLQCHDDDTGGKCGKCHEEGGKYRLGFDPGTGYVNGTTKVTSSHFGYKHYQAYEVNGAWKGGKFCWDCHDAHGDSNDFMMHDKVSTETDGTYGLPKDRKEVVFKVTDRMTGTDFYGKGDEIAKGLCNACHTNTNHYKQGTSDGHMSSRLCTRCHEHRFGDSHANGKGCNDCHADKPIPRHGGMGQPRGCTQCHDGVIGKRMDVMGQMRSASHHVQGVAVTNQQCWACHWEATDKGLIDVQYHEGYNNITHVSQPNAKVDLVVWGPNLRPATYNTNAGQGTVTAVAFTAETFKNGGLAAERGEVGSVTTHCLSCHSDQNNDSQPFEDCKTPRQYAWDRSSIAARYSDSTTTTWGKYAGTANAAKKNLTKAYSAHGNAKGNAGGFDAVNGEDGATITNTRGGNANVECFDCHSSHGSKAPAPTTSYATFDGTYNGGNLKETQAGKGGYTTTYKAAANASAVNPYGPGAAQCFDCHETANANTNPNPKPWGYASTFGATQPIVGYRDTPKFGAAGGRGVWSRYAYKGSKAIEGGHLKASTSKGPLKTTPTGTINGLCTPCHDPHGISPTLADSGTKPYTVPLLKGTWMTSPYKEDAAPRTPDLAGVSNPPNAWGKYSVNQNNGNDAALNPVPGYFLDRMTFGAGGKISEDETKFAGLCLRCHPKASLTDHDPQNAATDRNNPWKDVKRIHETVKDWGANLEHSFPCSKCHNVHVSGLPKLMKTNCLDWNHRSRVPSNGTQAWMADKESSAAHSYNNHRGYPNAEVLGPWVEAATACHFNAPQNATGVWPGRNLWNNVTPW